MSVSQRAIGGSSVPLDLFRRDRVLAVALVVVAGFLAFLIYHDVINPAAPANAGVNLTAVRTGTVSSAVSGTGTITALQQSNLNFSGVSGTVTEIDVKAGDSVQAGQVLAKIDPATYQQALDQANSSLTSAQAALNATLTGTDVVQSQHALDQAKQSYNDTVASVNLTNQQDQAALDGDNNQLNTIDQPALATCLQGDPSGKTCTPQQNAVNADKAKITSDTNRQQVDQLNGQKQINSAQNAVTNAQDSLNSKNAQRPATLAQQQAAVANAQASVQTAQKNLTNTTLTAPYAGQVSTLNGQVGDNVTGGASTSNSSQASSSSSQSSGGAAGGSSSSSSSSTGSNSSAFLVLSNVSGMQVVVPFAEADASRIQSNQQATVTFDAITGLSLPAHVVSVANIATVVSNVTNFSTTLVLDQLDRRLKLGMTANASVTVQQASNVLLLSNSAISHVAGAAFVTVLDSAGKQVRRQVQTGVVGDTTTEIVAGLSLGDRVVLPQARLQTNQAGGAGRGPGGGGGGVRIGGGGG